MSKKIYALSAAGTLVGMLGIGAVYAQTTGGSTGTGATGPTGEAGQSSGELMEIRVTALRRSEPLLKAPAAITAISGDQLSERGIVTVQDLQDVVPRVQMTTTGNGVNIVIRGIQTTDTSAKGEQDIAFNVDGVSYGRGLERTTAFFDVERVEVLRGPQGTLYGQSSTGGAVNIITN
jgi:iron complex outermembrane receptor protein